MKVIVIGGGPAGMMAAIQSSENGNDVILIEKMNMLVEAAHQIRLFHGKKHNHISISFDFGFFVCSGFLAPLSGAVWACSLSFARTEVFF